MPDHIATTNASASLARYSAVLLQIAITLVGAFAVLPDDAFLTPRTGVPAGLGLLAVALGAALTYWVPLLGAHRSSILKVAIPAAVGVIASLIQFAAAGDFSTTAVMFLVLAVLNGLASKLGVQIRKDSLGLAA